MRQLPLLKFLSIFFVMAVSANAFAQDGGGGGYFGFLYGLSVPDMRNTTDHRILGIQGGARITERVLLGGYHYMATEEAGPFDSRFSFNLTGLEGRLNLTTGDKQVFVSLRAGVTKVKTDISGDDVIFSPYHWGFATGYNWKIYTWCFLGIEGSYLAVDPSETTSNGTTQELETFHIMSFLGYFGVNF